MARRERRILLLVAAFALALSSCASSPEPRTTNEPPAAPRLDLPPLAATLVQAEAESVPSLTVAFREALVRTSGVDVIDQHQLEDALVACGEPPCPTDLTDVFARAPIVFSASIANAGDGKVLGMARAIAGSRVLKRTTAQGDDALTLVRKLGWELGAAVHVELATANGAAGSPAPDEAEEEP